MNFLTNKRLSRRTLLRGSGVALALPMLDIMMPQKAQAQSGAKYFFTLFCPNGTDPNDWRPQAGALTRNNLSKCLQDLNGFSAEQIWPACTSLLDDVTVVTRCGHRELGTDIHSPDMALQAYNRQGGAIKAASLDMKIAQRHKSVFPYLSMSAHPDSDLGQGYISWEGANKPADVRRDPQALFNDIFGAQAGSVAANAVAVRKASVLDFVLEEARKLKSRVGQADKLRVDQYLDSVRTVEEQLSVDGLACNADPISNFTQNNWHDKSKAFIDIGVLAMSCDLTRVATVQYSNSWGLNYSGYVLGDGTRDEAGTIGVGNHSDHFISHKLGDRDRAKDLDDLPQSVAQRIANDRVVLTSRFKVRRYAYLVDKLRNTSTPTGNLLDNSLALYCSENGNGDNHSRNEMPILLAGRAGGFQPGRVVDANGQQTQGLHCAILNRFGFELDSYGDPARGPIAGI